MDLMTTTLAQSGRSPSLLEFRGDFIDLKLASFPEFIEAKTIGDKIRAILDINKAEFDDSVCTDVRFREALRDIASQLARNPSHIKDIGVDDTQSFLRRAAIEAYGFHNEEIKTALLHCLTSTNNLLSQLTIEAISPVTGPSDSKNLIREHTFSLLRPESFAETLLAVVEERFTRDERVTTKVLIALNHPDIVLDLEQQKRVSALIRDAHYQPTYQAAFDLLNRYDSSEAIDIANKAIEIDAFKADKKREAQAIELLLRLQPNQKLFTHLSERARDNDIIIEMVPQLLESTSPLAVAAGIRLFHGLYPPAFRLSDILPDLNPLRIKLNEKNCDPSNVRDLLNYELKEAIHKPCIQNGRRAIAALDKLALAA